MVREIKNSLGIVVKTRYIYVNCIKYRYIITKTNSKSCVKHFIAIFGIGDKIALNGTSLLDSQLGEDKEKQKAFELIKLYSRNKLLSL